MSERTGQIRHVWNSLCSNRHGLDRPEHAATRATPPSGRATALRSIRRTATLVVATGNAPWNGSTNWGDSVLVLSPDASTMLRHYTPADHAAPERRRHRSRLDEPRAAPERLCGAGRQGRDPPAPAAPSPAGRQRQDRRRGADARRRPDRPRSSRSPPCGRAGGCSSRRTRAPRRFGSPAASSTRPGRTTPDGTSPVVAGSLLYVAGSGAVHVYVPTTGREVASAADGRRALAEPDRRRRARRGRRGRREHARQDRRARHLPSAVASRSGGAAPAAPAFRVRRR